MDERQILADVSTTLTDEEQDLLDDYIDYSSKIKELETKKEDVTKKIKECFANKKIKEGIYSGKRFTILFSTRKTVTKSKKDEFVEVLKNLNKKYLLQPSIEIDTESVVSEMEVGKLDKDLVAKYMKITPIETLKCQDV